MELSQLICDDLKGYGLKTCFFWCGDRSALWLTVKAAPQVFLLDSHENNSNCSHHMSDFNAKMYQIRFWTPGPAGRTYSAPWTLDGVEEDWLPLPLLQLQSTQCREAAKYVLIRLHYTSKNAHSFVWRSRRISPPRSLTLSLSLTLILNQGGEILRERPFVYRRSSSHWESGTLCVYSDALPLAGLQ